MKPFPASFCLMAAWTTTLVAALPAATAAADAWEPRIVDVRVGKHPGYDRLVLELDRDAEVRRRQNPDEGELDVLVRASPALRLHVPEAHQDRMGVVVIEATSQGARVTATPRPRRIRAFRLASPSRVVVDFADPRGPELPMPGDALPIAMTAETPPPAAEPEPAPEPEEPLPHVGEAPPPAAEEPPPPAALPPPEPEAPTGPPTAAPAHPPQLQPPLASAPPTPAAPAPREEEPLPGESLLPEREPTPEPGREVASEGQLRAFGIPFLLGSTVTALIALWLVLARSSRQARQAAPPPPPEALFEASSRMDLLEKRMDEEVRARMHFEEKVSGLHEDLKVIRDRLNRLNR